MAKITILGNAIVITSEILLEDLKLVEKCKPNKLVLRELDEATGKNIDVFRIGTVIGNGDANKYGIAFSDSTNDTEGRATVTLVSPLLDVDVKEYVADKYGEALMKLNQLETIFEAAIDDIKEQKAAVLENITVIS